jgi:hypothetical protein
MNKFFLTILPFFFAASVVAQSGRIKPSEKPTPEITPRERIVYVPTERNSEMVKPSASPTPKVKADETDEDVIRVEASLVPIPVSVIDGAGRAVTNLRIEDFQLEVDGKIAEISEISGPAGAFVRQ